MGVGYWWDGVWLFFWGWDLMELGCGGVNDIF